jgi:parallel beta-helix repeat protein
MHRKIVAVWVSLMIIISSIVILIEIAPRVTAPTTLYVGSGGGGNYSKIQWAIDNTSDGDTVFVYNGTYYEHVVVNKTINLIGEDRNNTIIDGEGTGIVLKITFDWVNITGFTIIRSGPISSGYGLQLDNVQNCTISNNKITDNNWGIYLTSSSNNNILNNNVSSNNNYGMYIFSSSNNNIINNNCSSHTFVGILLLGSSSNNIINSTAADNEYGIYLMPSSNYNNITGNNIYLNKKGIFLEASMNNNIRNNYIANNSAYGIESNPSINNTIRNNNFINNGIMIWGDQLSYYNSHNISSDNKVNGKPVYYYKNRNGLNINAIPVGQLILSNCTNVSIRNLRINNTDLGIQVSYSKYINAINNKISENEWGMMFYSVSESEISLNEVANIDFGGIGIYYSSNISFTNNTAMSCRMGFVIALSSNNTITYNNAKNNIAYGFQVSQSYNNNIFHNNIIDSTFNQVCDTTNNGNQWDNGYPSGGNYWSNFDDSSEGAFDDFNGIDQNIPDSDGIVDLGPPAGGKNPYVIDSDSQDNYPLMEYYIYTPIENSTLLKKGWNLISLPLIQQNNDLIKVLEAIDGNYDAIQRFDPTYLGDPWKHYKVGKPLGNDLFELNETMSFWIHITQTGDTIFLFNGTTPIVNQTIQLYKGWNMVGYPSLSNHNRTVGLNNLSFDTHVDAIQWYDAATQTWYFMGPDDKFVPGRGYWVHSKVDAEWEVPL